jgi:hypothetical protein
VTAIRVLEGLHVEISVLLPSSSNSLLKLRRDSFNVTGIRLLPERSSDLLLISGWQLQVAIEGQVHDLYLGTWELLLLKGGQRATGSTTLRCGTGRRSKLRKTGPGAGYEKGHGQ